MSNLGTNPVLTFASAMQDELNLNSHKGTWRRSSRYCSVKAFLERLHEEVEEIETAVKAKLPAAKILSECADVGNFAMMIADNYKST